MLTKDEEGFLIYWEQERLKKKKFLRKLSIGLPLAVSLSAALFINFLSGWYKKATMDIQEHSSVIIVVLVAIIGIVIFITIFSARHQWDQNELHYKELLKKKNQS